MIQTISTVLGLCQKLFLSCEQVKRRHDSLSFTPMTQKKAAENPQALDISCLIASSSSDFLQSHPEHMGQMFSGCFCRGRRQTGSLCPLVVEASPATAITVSDGLTDALGRVTRGLLPLRLLSYKP